MSDNLVIQNLHVSVEGTKILRNLNLTVAVGKIHVLMGPNGSGKSTLANTLMGHPKYQVTQGKIIFEGKNIVRFEADKRAKLGIFLAFQYPLEIPGVSLSNFLRTAYNSTHNEKVSPLKFGERLKDLAKKLKIEEAFLDRYLNEGFSGGEKKKAEILQMSVLEPKIAILDETDSGLDIDALKIVARGVKECLSPTTGVLLITHYQRILNYLETDYVHILSRGKIVKEGGPELVKEIEEKGFTEFTDINL